MTDRTVPEQYQNPAVLALLDERDEIAESLGGMVEWQTEVIVDTRDALRVGGCDEHVLTAEQLGALEAATRILARERNTNPSRFDAMKDERDALRAEVERVRESLSGTTHALADSEVERTDARRLLAELREEYASLRRNVYCVPKYDRQKKALAERDAALDRVRVLHTPHHIYLGDADPIGGWVCRECGEPTESEPCATIRALDVTP